MSRIRMFAFPYAMGGASAYAGLREKSDKADIQLIPLDYPGHERRFCEELLGSMQEIAMDAYKEISDQLYGDYCLFGYSMGGTICYELYQLLRLKGRRLPQHVFLLAADHPGAAPDYTGCENMSLQRAKEIFDEMGGTPDEILQSDDIMEMLLPIAQKDLTATEKYIPTLSCKFDCGVTLVRGSGELNNSATLDGWNARAEHPCDYYEIDGGHFFMFDSDEGLQRVCDIVQDALK